MAFVSASQVAPQLFAPNSVTRLGNFLGALKFHHAVGIDSDFGIAPIKF